MNINYIVVQAGGKGTRLEHLTANKPKAIVPVENLPMLFHLFRKFPDKRYIIIADYKHDVLHEYLAAFADVKYQIINADGRGTCGGISQAAKYLPDKEPFMLIWSDLILPESFDLSVDEDNYIGLSQTFPCRWKYKSGKFVEKTSTEEGVAGLFIFKDKSYIGGVPQSGELVRHFKEQGMRFTSIGLAGTREFGTLNEYNKLSIVKTRPFNKMTFNGDIVIKKPIDKQGEELAKLEQKWYEYAQAHNFSAIPKIYKTEPLAMERIDGCNIYEYLDLAVNEKREILRKMTENLNQLHSVECVPVDTFSLKNAYYTKTIDRLNKIRDLIPLADRKTITVNGRECRNIYFYKREFERLLEAVKCGKFTFIHGDCTFSNLMLRKNGEPVFIDPRGYFGYTELYGDPNYDWAKLYYSVVGNYDRFNLKEFLLKINENDVELSINSNHWEGLESHFFELSGTDKQIIKLLHAIIWLSLTTYAWQDYDSVCGAFYNGLYYLEDCWK